MMKNKNKESLLRGSQFEVGVMVESGFRLGGRNDRKEKIRNDNSSRVMSHLMRHPVPERAKGESGRSMVEMLGTLAIIGVLSIGGVAGYRYAMTKYHANEIFNKIQKRAVIISSQRILGQEASLAEFNNEDDSIDLVDSPYMGEFALQVTRVSQAVCEQLIKENFPIALATFVNGEEKEEGRCQNTDNVITFYIADTLGGDSDYLEICDTAVDCKNGCTPSCVKGLCRYAGCNGENEICDRRFCVAVGGECRSNDDCTEPDTFCAISATYAAGTESSFNGYNGICVDIGGSASYRFNNKIFTVNAYGTHKINSWWSARNWCEARKMSMVSLFDAGCSLDTKTCTSTNNWSLTIWVKDVTDQKYGYAINTKSGTVAVGQLLSSGYLSVLCE